MSSTKDAAGAAGKTAQKKAKVPKTVLEKLAAAIVALDSPQDGGSSRQSIAKYAKDHFGVVNPTAVAKALKAGVTKGTLIQTKQSFTVKGFEPSQREEVPQLGIDDVLVGDGDEAVSGSTCTMKYVGTLVDGTKFDSASKFTFTIDAGEVIKGWDQGVKGMRVGGRRKLVCPPKLGYGKRGSPPEIPGDATLHFTVTLVAVQ